MPPLMKLPLLNSCLNKRSYTRTNAYTPTHSRTPFDFLMLPTKTMFNSSRVVFWTSDELFLVPNECQDRSPFGGTGDHMNVLCVEENLCFVSSIVQLHTCVSYKMGPLTFILYSVWVRHHTLCPRKSLFLLLFSK